MRSSRAAAAAVSLLAGMLGVQMARRLLARRRRMPGEHALITGGSRGLGLALARECVRRGASVTICARDPGELRRAGDLLRNAGGRVLELQCDVRDARQIRSAVQRAHAAYGRIDLLVNNAGTIAVGPMECMTARDYEDALQTHFWGAYHAVEACVPIMESQGSGRIANVTSIGGKISVPHLLPYSVSKFAAVGYSQGLRAELRRKNIRVTTVCPGLMRTGSPRNALFKSQHRKEYAWFALSDTLPGTSIAASSAARGIIDAVLAGRAEIVLSLPAQIAVLLHGVAPAFTAALLGLMNRLLPGPGGAGERAVPGRESESALTQSLLTALGRKAEREYNQI